MNKKKMIAPSVLSADFGHLARDVQMLDKSDCDWIHVDVMDGNFVPNISFGFPVLKAIRKETKKPVDVHLMIENAAQYVKEFKEAGADWLTVHFENNVHLNRVCQLIRSHGMKAGVALNPGTPVESLIDVLEVVDLVLVMSVNPGFGGQKFIENTYSKLMRLAEMREEFDGHFLIEVDGGVNDKNAGKLFQAGADVLVAGSAVFKAENPTEMISRLKA